MKWVTKVAAEILVLTAFVMLSAGESWSVQPYEPVQPDPVLESWRWTSFPELKGLRLSSMAPPSSPGSRR